MKELIHTLLNYRIPFRISANRRLTVHGGLNTYVHNDFAYIEII